MIGIEQFGSAARRQTGTAARPASRCTAQVQVRPDVCEREPAHLDQPEETLGAEHPVILVQVAHVSAGGNEHGTGSKNSGALLALARKVTRFDALLRGGPPCALRILFGVADAVGDFYWSGRGCLWHVNEGIDNGIKGQIRPL